jgi:hypothetical protein
MTIQAKQWTENFASQIPQLSADQMTEDVLWYIQNYDWVTPVELVRRYREQGKGNHSLCSQDNIVIWDGMSEKLVAAILQLLRAKAIHCHPSSPLTYLIDGACLTLPLAKRPPKGGYTKEHWLPITFRDGPWCMAKECPHRPRKFHVRESSK